MLRSFGVADEDSDIESWEGLGQLFENLAADKASGTSPVSYCQPVDIGFRQKRANSHLQEYRAHGYGELRMGRVVPEGVRMR